MIEVRAMHKGEADVLGQVMWDAIHSGCSAYTHAQRLAWLAVPPSGADWETRLTGQSVWVAASSGVPVGFLTMAGYGYIDLAFVRADMQGQGVFSVLYRALEYAARARGLRHLFTHASLMAQPAFAARGFHVIGHETVLRSGQTLARAEMEKKLE